MALIHGKDTGPELRLRWILRRLGIEYRSRDKRLKIRPDAILLAPKIAVFVHGCFWHQHTCRLSRKPKSRLNYWLPKLQRTKARDRRQLAALSRSGWKYLVVWECELSNPSVVVEKLVKIIEISRDPRR